MTLHRSYLSLVVRFGRPSLGSCYGALAFLRGTSAATIAGLQVPADVPQSVSAGRTTLARGTVTGRRSATCLRLVREKKNKETGWAFRIIRRARGDRMLLSLNTHRVVRGWVRAPIRTTQLSPLGSLLQFAGVWSARPPFRGRGVALLALISCHQHGVVPLPLSAGVVAGRGDLFRAQPGGRISPTKNRTPRAPAAHGGCTLGGGLG